MLTIPVNVPRFVEKAHLRGADAIILDLEDSVVPAQKARARTLVRPAAAGIAPHADVLVRINRPLDLAVRDIEAVVCADVAALMLPKVDSAAHLRLLAEVVATVERSRGLPDGHTAFVPMVEDTAAFTRIVEIAAGDRRNVGLCLGGEDFAVSMGTRPDPDVMLYPKQQMVIAARAAGIVPFGMIGSIANYQDLDGMRAVIAMSARFGFEGAVCVHPSAIPVFNEGFAPDPAAVARARRMVAAYAQCVAEGRGAAEFEGVMIDAPVVQQAERLIARARPA